MKNQSTRSVIPSGELQCVWMEAGVSEFKLCDQEFRCESCEFNTTVTQQRLSNTQSSNQQHSHVPLGSRAMTADSYFSQTLKTNIENLRTASIPDNRMYSRSHFWIQQHESGGYRIGIDHILANFFRPILSIVISKAPLAMHRHDPFCWIILPGGAITLRSPLDATISRFNPALHHKPNLLSTEPFDEGWIMEITTKPKSLNTFTSPLNTQQHMERTLRNVEHVFTQAYRHLHPPTGTTLFDGGVGVDNIESILGSKIYLEVVNRILHLPS
jgi:glycine cleavage system H protein